MKLFSEFRQQFAISVFALALVIAGAMISAACQLCIGLPQQTEADLLLASDCVILARPDTADPFQFAPTETLKGVYDGSEIDLLVDSATRSFLQIHPDRSALLVRDEAAGSWRSLGTISEAYEALARRLVVMGQGWHGPEAAADRWQCFLPFFGHEDQRLHELAYLELGRAPYAVIRKLGQSVSRETYWPMLAERRYYEWRGLAILLLAQSGSASDNQYILDSFQAAERYGVAMNLDAWATAAIEVDREATIQLIETNYLCSTQRTDEEIQAVMRALSRHGSLQDAALRGRIVSSYKVLLKNFPQFAPHVAKDLAAWNRIELTDELLEVLSLHGELPVAERQIIDDYLAVATQRTSEDSHD